MLRLKLRVAALGDVHRLQVGIPQTLVGITASGGLVYESDFVPHIVPTVHPSSLLRIADRARRAEAYSGFVEDLVRARDLLD
jgi:hypothetical protein